MGEVFKIMLLLLLLPASFWYEDLGEEEVA
jgi:hypothetical protein